MDEDFVIECENCGRKTNRYVWIDDLDRHYFCSVDCAAEGMEISYDEALDAIYSGSDDEED